jgi:histidyl-tRNA synthetase
MAIKAVRGVRDILPSETGRWQRVEAAGATFEAYGYREIRRPSSSAPSLARGIGARPTSSRRDVYLRGQRR